MKQFSLTLLFPSITLSVAVLPVEVFPFLPDEAAPARAFSAEPSHHFHHVRLRHFGSSPATFCSVALFPPYLLQINRPPPLQGAAAALQPVKM